ncbi:MAG: polyisoprenoid-binding protein [Nitrospiraceae bacterium]|nr:MAG: polyisoprenoid-binding protein [Nitrospiraceae bacterium]
MKKYVLAVFVLCSLSFPFAVQAAEWQYDTTHTRFYFEIDHTFAKVRGYFEDFSGTFRFDPKNPKDGKIDVEIKVKSINTGVPKRDNHLRSGDFFDVAKYPLITFKSKKITHKEGGVYLVEGDFTMKDVTKTLVLPLIYLGTKDNPLQEGELVAGFETKLTIDRFDYHVGTGKFYEIGVVGKDVDITAVIEVVRKK